MGCRMVKFNGGGKRRGLVSGLQRVDGVRQVDGTQMTRDLWRMVTTWTSGTAL